MACIRKRRGKYVVDYYDGAGNRRWVTCETKKEANDVLSDKLRKLGTVKDSNITLREYSEKWLERVSATVKIRTLESYQLSFEKHILPALGNIKLRKLQRATIKEFLAGKQKEDDKGKKLKGNTVRIINAALRACLAEAIEDNLIPSNPAAGLTKKLKLVSGKNENVKAMDREQLFQFLSKVDTWYFPFFLLLKLTRNC